MAKVAMCSGCGRRVVLTPQGECPQGHLRSMLRDIRDGVEPPPVATVAPTPRPPAPAPSGDDLVAAVLGKAVIIVPIVAIIAFALWTGYEESVGSGTSAWVALLLSVGSLALTIGGAVLWVGMRKRK